MKLLINKITKFIFIFLLFIFSLSQISSSFENKNSINEKIYIPNLKKTFLGSEKITSIYTFSAEEVVNNNFNFNSLNSNEKPFINFFNGQNWIKQKAQHSYSSSVQGFGASRAYDVMQTGWNGANINIANNLYGWRYADGFGNWSWIKKFYLNSRSKPEGLNYDDGSFSKIYIDNIPNISYDAFNKFKLKFGLNNIRIKQFQNNPQVYETIETLHQFGSKDNEGVDITFHTFKNINLLLNNAIDKINRNGKIFLNGYLSNVNIDLNFHLKTDKYNGGTLSQNFKNQIDYFKIKIDFNFHYNYEGTSPEKTTFYNNLEAIKNNFTNQFLNSNNTLIINTDTGYSGGLKTPKISKSDKSNQEYLEEKLLNWWNQVANKENLTLKYKDLSNNKIAVYLEIINPDNNLKNIFYLNSKINLEYFKTEKYKSKNLSNRIIITPHKFLDLTNWKNLDFVDDKPTLVEENNKPISENYGGKWIYNVPVKIDFSTTIKEDEILLINNQKIDVIDQNFSIDLYDFRYKKDGKNTYLIELQKFDKENVNQENKVIIKKWNMEIIINSLISNLDVKWYAWNPENNKNQKVLIEEYLKNENNDFILDENGNKKINPNFDPLIDPSTGTKKQIVWVQYSNLNKNLPNETRFLQDPLNRNGELINNYKNYDIGFLAEASVVSKGINLKINNPNNFIKRFKILNNQNNFEFSYDPLVKPLIKTGHQINLSDTENNYFSSSGNWLFTYHSPKGMTGYKMVYIDENFFNNQLYTSVFINKKVEYFWDSYHGNNLANFLIKKYNFNRKNLEKIPYEILLEYWKDYVDFYLKNREQNKKYYKYINPKISLSKIQEYTKTISFEEFEKNKNIPNEHFWDNFENQDKLTYKIETNTYNKNLLKIYFYLKDQILNDEWKIGNDSIEILVQWKEKEKENFNPNKDKKQIKPIVNKEEILRFSQNLTSEEFFQQPFNLNWLNFENQDKVNFSIMPDEEEFYIFFYINSLYIQEYYLNFEDSFIKVPVDFLKNKNLIINLENLINENEFILENQDDETEIEKIILEKFSQNMANLKYGKDYEIENLKEKTKEIKLKKVLNAKNNDVYTLIKVKSKYNNFIKVIGQKIIKIFNESTKIFINENSEIAADQDSNFDLSILNIKNLEYKNVEISKLKEIILKDIEQQLKAQNIYFDSNLYIEDLDNKIYSLWLQPDKEENQIFKIKPINKKFSDYKKFKVLIKSKENSHKIDLKNFKFAELKLKETNPKIILEKIKNYILEQTKKYNLKEQEDFIVTKFNDINLLKKLVENVNKNNSIEIIFESVPNHKKLFGKTGLIISNNFEKMGKKDILLWKNAVKNNQINDEEKEKNYWWILGVVLICIVPICFILRKFYFNFIVGKKFK